MANGDYDENGRDKTKSRTQSRARAQSAASLGALSTYSMYDDYRKKEKMNRINAAYFGPGIVPFQWAIGLFVLATLMLVSGLTVLILHRLQKFADYSDKTEAIGPVLMACSIGVYAFGVYLIIKARRLSNEARRRMVLRGRAGSATVTMMNSNLHKTKEQSADTEQLKSGTYTDRAQFGLHLSPIVATPAMTPHGSPPQSRSNMNSSSRTNTTTNTTLPKGTSNSSNSTHLKAPSGTANNRSSPSKQPSSPFAMSMTQQSNSRTSQPHTSQTSGMVQTAPPPPASRAPPPPPASRSASRAPTQQRNYDDVFDSPV